MPAVPAHRQAEVADAGQDQADHRRGEGRHRAAGREADPGAVGVGDPADDRGADRRAAEEDHHVEGHDTAAHRRVRGHLDAGVRRDVDRHAEQAQRDHEQGEHPQRGGRRGQDLQRAEGHRRHDQQP
jgi:hypothetical protein